MLRQQNKKTPVLQKKKKVEYTYIDFRVHYKTGKIICSGSLFSRYVSLAVTDCLNVLLQKETWYIYNETSELYNWWKEGCINETHLGTMSFMLCKSMKINHQKKNKPQVFVDFISLNLKWGTGKQIICGFW